MDNYDFSRTALKILHDTFRGLTRDQLDQLVDGRAKLAFLPPGAKVQVPAASLDAVRDRLAAIEDRQEAERYVTGLKLKKDDLVALARQLGVVVRSKDRVADVTRNIVEGTVGVRVDHNAIRDSSW
ncbi:hypothetical protein [Actinophytocola xanthii]|uniref:Uncharacterized protein n=1 Tax=Actinophytocola xanthii TaxID=1912961 RepID=A0A1Q8CSA2_9PSEU|nr:hypothetical protein [Actinophytocola xanthii]OLF17261.1 hypothetical protein BU204_12805 [Actinophytocola xanthii]